MMVVSTNIILDEIKSKYISLNLMITMKMIDEEEEEEEEVENDDDEEVEDPGDDDNEMTMDGETTRGREREFEKEIYI